MCEELKECPFCGNTPILLMDLHSSRYMVKCDSCDDITIFTTYMDRENHAIRAWNVRA